MSGGPDELAALAGRPDLVEEVREIESAGKLAWPQVAVSPARLAASVVARAAHGAAPGAERHDADLYLSSALGEGDRAALAAFETQFVPEIDAALARMRLPAALVDEVRQAVRVNVLVGDTRTIDRYLGFGPLAAWLRVIATRMALKQLRTTTREETLDEALLGLGSDPHADPANAHLRRTYSAELKAAVQAALASLTVRERNLLRQHVLDDLTIDELALIYRVSRSTCARWLVDARARLGRATRRMLSERLGPREGQLDSVLRWVESELSLSLSRVLREPA
ncbi:MAG: sigma-70 family RNA polymerase sigma factor [Kofleriaceae bacterium]